MSGGSGGMRRWVRIFFISSVLRIAAMGFIFFEQFVQAMSMSKTRLRSRAQEMRFFGGFGWESVGISF